MLKHFLYLNDDTLSAYLSALEGGRRDSIEQRSASKRGVGGGLDVKAISAKADRARETETTMTIGDTAQARFERLEELAKADFDRSGWIDVVDPDRDLAAVKVGHLIDIECEIHVPAIIKALSKSGGLSDMLDFLEALKPMASVFEADMSNGPTTEQAAAMRFMTNNLGNDQVLVGEPDSDSWRVAGKLLAPNVTGEIDGLARVVGKVSTIWKEGEWKPLLSLPGANLMPREQRRKLERTKPSADQQDNWLEGPAVMLDVLAVYR